MRRLALALVGIILWRAFGLAVVLACMLIMAAVI